MRKDAEYWLRRINKRHARRSLRRKLKFRVYKKHKNRLNQGVPREKQKERNINRDKFGDFKKEIAPENFSLINNPERTNAFLQRLFEDYKRHSKVFVDLRNVKSISHDAIVVLLSIMVHFRSSHLKFNGNYPRDAGIRDTLVKSGFFSRLYDDIRDEEGYILTGEGNSFYTHANRNVDPILSDKIIEKASLTVWKEKRRCLGLQRVFMELMQNTNNHASLHREGEKLWWVSVNHDSDRKVVSFSFIDFGVGIIKSLENKNLGTKFFNWLEKFSRVHSFSTNDELLKLVLEGELHKTVTGKYYRGKGLPGIANAFNNGSISRLYFITNDVFADLEGQSFITLNNSLPGTFVYWELNESNHNLPW